MDYKRLRELENLAGLRLRPAEKQDLRREISALEKMIAQMREDSLDRGRDSTDDRHDHGQP